MSQLQLPAHRIVELREQGVGVCLTCFHLQLCPAGVLIRCGQCEQFEVVPLEDALHAGVLDVLPGEDN